VSVSQARCDDGSQRDLSVIITVVELVIGAGAWRPTDRSRMASATG
jgi:hypothetical protein